MSNYTVEDQALPESFNEYKIANLSDPHSKDWGTPLIDLIEEEN